MKTPLNRMEHMFASSQMSPPIKLITRRRRIFNGLKQEELESSTEFKNLPAIVEKSNRLANILDQLNSLGC
jgi:hypothetical protein